MCHQCSMGQPHWCFDSNAYEGGKGNFSQSTYREEPRRILRQGREEVHHEDDRGEDPLAHLTIRTRTGHLISTGTHLPEDATRRGSDDEDAILAETMLTAGPQPS